MTPKGADVCGECGMTMYDPLAWDHRDKRSPQYHEFREPAPAKGDDVLPDSELARIEALAAKARGRFFIRDDGPPYPNHEAIEYINVVFDAVPKLVAALRNARRERDDFELHLACATQREAAESERDRTNKVLELERLARMARDVRLERVEKGLAAAESERDELKEMVELERAENAKRLNTAFERELHALRERDALRAVIEAHACPPDARHHACVGCDLRAAYDAAREGGK